MQKGEWIEKVYDHVIACNSLKAKISQMEVVEDFESRPHKAESCVVEREKEMQEWKTSRSCQRCCLVTVDEVCHEEAQKKKAEKKGR